MTRDACFFLQVLCVHSKAQFASERAQGPFIKDKFGSSSPQIYPTYLTELLGQPATPLSADLLYEWNDSPGGPLCDGAGGAVARVLVGGAAGGDGDAARHRRQDGHRPHQPRRAPPRTGAL